jgi:hypothetical protein
MSKLVKVVAILTVAVVAMAAKRYVTLGENEAVRTTNVSSAERSAPAMRELAFQGLAYSP